MFLHSSIRMFPNDPAQQNAHTYIKNNTIEQKVHNTCGSLPTLLNERTALPRSDKGQAMKWETKRTNTFSECDYPGGVYLKFCA